MRPSRLLSWGDVATWQPRAVHRVMATADGGEPVPWLRHETDVEDAVAAVVEHYEALRRCGAVRAVRIECGTTVRIVK